MFRERVTIADLEAVVGQAEAALISHLNADWNLPATASDWTCWEVVEHTSNSLFSYAVRLVAVPDAVQGPFAYDYREKRAGGLESFIFARAETGATGLVRIFSQCAGLLSCAVRTADPAHQADHVWGRSDVEGFAAMGVVEIAAHIHDIADPLGFAWRPDRALCNRVLARLFPHAPVTSDGWATLLWATGRGELPGHARPGSDWRWYAEPR